jgi:hypothetical protein
LREPERAEGRRGKRERREREEGLSVVRMEEIAVFGGG